MISDFYFCTRPKIPAPMLENIMDDVHGWHPAYHGTTVGRLPVIMFENQLLHAGETTRNGWTIPICDGHITPPFDR